MPIIRDEYSGLPIIRQQKELRRIPQAMSCTQCAWTAEGRLPGPEQEAHEEMTAQRQRNPRRFLFCIYGH